MRYCPKCGGSTQERWVDEPVALMDDPPRQVERFVRYCEWQCMRFQDHRGTYQRSVDSHDEEHLPGLP